MDAQFFDSKDVLYNWFLNKQKNSQKKIGAKNDMYEFKKLCLGQKFRNDLCN